MKTTLPLALILLAATLTFAQSPSSQTRLRPIQQDGKWGYIDNTGRIVIQPQFYSAEEFSEGLAAFENEDGKHGYIDETGKIVIEPKFDNWTSFSEGLAAVSIDFKWGYIDKSGKWAIPNKFTVGRPFSDGMALVGVSLNAKVARPGPMKYIFIDKTGWIVFDVEHNILNGTFAEGAGTVQYITTNDIKEVVIDKTGKVVVEVQEIDTFGFSEGLVPAKQNGKWGYIDINGRFVIQPQFEAAQAFSEGLAAVLVGKKWGYIDHNGKIVIKARYDVGYDPKQHRFSEGLALVYSKEKCCYVDKTGKVVITVACSDAGRFDGGIASVRIGEEKAEKRGYINKQGKYIWGPVAYKYQTLEEISARTEKQAKEEEVLTPLTDEEKALNLKNLIWRQPNFAADLNFFIGEGFGGQDGAYRLVRKGNRYRQESESWVYVDDDDKSFLQLIPITRSYDDYKPARGRSADSIPINPRALPVEKDVTFTALGTKTIDGHYCLKVEAVRQSKPDTKYYFYVALDLYNLVIVAQVMTPRRAAVQRLANISFNVYDSLVQIPADYKTIKHDRWTKVEDARVTYKGRFVKDASVFRAPEGQLFLRVNDWTYLVRPNEGTVETAFEGLLVTPEGQFVWTTNENEAYSSTGYRDPRPPAEWESKKDRRAIVKPNSVKFRSTDYERDKAMIEVRW